MDRDLVKISWYGKYFWEEPVLIGNKKQGTGAIFFSGCSLHCVFCQNYQISQEGLGKLYNLDELVDIIIELQCQGVVTIDLVSPTIWGKQIEKALINAKRKGLKIPVIWNSNAYEQIDDLKRLKGLVDIYLPDFKYGDDKIAWKYSRAKNYSAVALQSIKEMFAQVGILKIGSNGVAQKGVIVRHLILPNNLENSFLSLRLLSKISKDLMISLMSQYYPVYKAKEYPEINRKLTQEEFTQVYNYFKKIGFHSGWIQEGGDDNLLPDFQKKNPFK